MTSTEIDTDFYRKYGDLTMYAFTCGYIQTVNGEKDYTESIAYMYAEGNCYHIRRPLAEGEKYHLPRGWDSYDSVTEARAALRRYGPFTNHRDGGTVHPKQRR